MIVRSWHSRAHSLLSSARKAPPRRSAQPHTAHAEKLSTSGQLMQLMQKSSAQEVSSCRRAQHKRSVHGAHAEELNTAHAEELNTAHAEELSIAHAGELSTAHAEELSTTHAEELSIAHASELSHSSFRRAQP